MTESFIPVTSCRFVRGCQRFGKPTASILEVKSGGYRFLRNVGNHVNICFVFEIYRVQISVRRPAILTEFFFVFLSPLRQMLGRY
jgi:hypothetical protein